MQIHDLESVARCVLYRLDMNDTKYIAAGSKVETLINCVWVVGVTEGGPASMWKGHGYCVNVNGVSHFVASEQVRQLR